MHFLQLLLLHRVIFDARLHRCARSFKDVHTAFHQVRNFNWEFPFGAVVLRYVRFGSLPHNRYSLTVIYFLACGATEQFNICGQYCESRCTSLCQVKLLNPFYPKPYSLKLPAFLSADLLDVLAKHSIAEINLQENVFFHSCVQVIPSPMKKLVFSVSISAVQS